jgi:hypothetical protein
MKSKWMTAVLLAVAVAAGSGCAVVVVGAAAGAGAGGYAYIKGEAKATEAASLDRTWTATLTAMKDLQFPIISQTKDALQGLVVARNASDKKITVKVEKVGEATTEVRVRIGTFGDEALSRVIIDKIKSHL